MTANGKVLVIYTGGTIGSMLKDEHDPDSPQIVVPADKFKKYTPELEESKLGFETDYVSIPKPLDSCNIGPNEWVQIASIIGEHYESYVGFVVLHGTDSMIYTASALSFMLANLGKPVVLTGAQRTHLIFPRNDSRQNLIDALYIANPAASKIPLVPEVMIVFGHQILRGNRTRKRDANGYVAYESPKYPPLGVIGANIVIDESRILPKPTSTFFVRRNIESQGIITFDVFPGIQTGPFAKLLLRQENLKGVILRAYGSGNIPTDEAFLTEFEKAQKSGVYIQDVTQCTHGRVELGLYETSTLLLEIGMLSGTDLTPEAALCKMMVGLGDEDLTADPRQVREYLQVSQAGEQSTSIYELEYRSPGTSVNGQSPKQRFAPVRPYGGTWEPNGIEGAMLRFYGAKIEGNERLEIEIYANLPTGDDPKPGSLNYVGTYFRVPTKASLTSKDTTILAFDVISAIRRFLGPRERVSFTLVLKSGDGVFSWERCELVLFMKS